MIRWAVSIAVVLLVAGCGQAVGPKERLAKAQAADRERLKAEFLRLGLDLSPELAKLYSVGAVEGRFVGAGGTPGQFYLLAQDFEQKGNRAAFELLLTSRKPVVRAMGIYCLARTAKSNALPILTKEFSDGDFVEMRPIGCLGRDQPVGEFAWTMVHDVEYLHHFDGFSPIIPADQVIEVDLRLLADDQHWLVHDTVSRFLADEIARPRFCLDVFELVHVDADNAKVRIGIQLNWPWIKGHCPNCPPEQVLKAIGRINLASCYFATEDPCTSVPGLAGAKIIAFLAASLNNEVLPANARLAAASALTRQVSPQGVAAIAANADFLDGVAGRRFARDLEQDIRLRMELSRLDSLVYPTRHSRTLFGFPKRGRLLEWLDDMTPGLFSHDSADLEEPQPIAEASGTPHLFGAGDGGPRPISTQPRAEAAVTARILALAEQIRGPAALDATDALFTYYSGYKAPETKTRLARILLATLPELSKHRQSWNTDSDVPRHLPSWFAENEGFLEEELGQSLTGRIKSAVKKYAGPIPELPIRPGLFGDE